MAEEKQILFRFYWNCGRMGSLEGLFVDTQAAVDAAIGKLASFGEVLEKHSEIYGELEAEHITPVEESDEEFASKFVKIVGSIGLNPLNYIQCNECGKYPEECECKKD